MTDEDLFGKLEALGFVKTFMGGATHVYIKGNIVVSGADCDLPSEHWYCVAVYADWQSGEDEQHWTSYDFSGVAEHADLGNGPRDIMADVATAELIAGMADNRAELLEQLEILLPIASNAYGVLTAQLEPARAAIAKARGMSQIAKAQTYQEMIAKIQKHEALFHSSTEG